MRLSIRLMALGTYPAPSPARVKEYSRKLNRQSWLGCTISSWSSLPVSLAYFTQAAHSSVFLQRTRPPNPALSRALAIVFPLPLVLPLPMSPRIWAPSQAMRMVQGFFGVSHSKGSSREYGYRRTGRELIEH